MTAYDGWKKATSPGLNTEREFLSAIERFIQLHGDLPIETIRKSHARIFREALQLTPAKRLGELRKLPLQEFVKRAEEFKDLPKLSEHTINKQLGGLQAILKWARKNGFIDEDTQWADPFEDMRLEAEASEKNRVGCCELEPSLIVSRIHRRVSAFRWWRRKLLSGCP